MKLSGLTALVKEKVVIALLIWLVTQVRITKFLRIVLLGHIRVSKPLVKRNVSFVTNLDAGVLGILPKNEKWQRENGIILPVQWEEI